MSSKDKTNDPPAPASGNATSGEPPAQTAADQKETLEELQARCEALETKITALEEGEKQWTEKNLSPLRQAIADLQATLQEIPPNVTGQVKTLRDELTQQLHELQQAVTPPNQSPPANPADPPAPPQETPPDQPPQPPADAGAPASQTQKKPHGKRVV